MLTFSLFYNHEKTLYVYNINILVYELHIKHDDNILIILDMNIINNNVRFLSICDEDNSKLNINDLEKFINCLKNNEESYLNIYHGMFYTNKNKESYESCSINYDSYNNVLLFEICCNNVNKSIKCDIKNINDVIAEFTKFYDCMKKILVL